ncbi:3-phosphoshikimate 1-carboxyvinyltransferase [Candidatus Nardonella dryophthoridicola]|uniref:3-phosphoshikimate 1-carboxyvinyltransferase n=1 Tax=endosymbiont of Metamasius hemipterus TaxID=204627 RepID=A0ABT0TWD3_9GAMM|nr:3-phosphoshikimate 1-carboxyvinyltransferase [Candidatus Nardonella dryophthoridicola]MCM0158302.1 3-phosphoshikimate 1-carboxyvinyltransferase [endosymbiont of Metamasius hemipterus]
MKKLIINPINKINGIINLPGSKSISNRALLISALINKEIKLYNILNCDDVKYMILSLIKIGIKIEKNNNEYIIKNSYFDINLNNNIIKLFVGNSGTTMRFLTSMLSIKKCNIILDGDERMRKRPINDLVDSLREGGAIIKYLNEENFPPINLKGGYKGGNINIKGDISSQFLSSLLMISPFIKNNININIINNLVSKPYIDTTINMIKNITNIDIINNNYNNFIINNKNKNFIYSNKYYIEGDASNASYFLSAGIIKGGIVRIYGINKNSIQGDIKFINIIKKIGGNIILGENYIETYNNNNKLNNINEDFNDIPDVAMTAVILSLFSNNKNFSTFKNIYNWRLKETNRLLAMKNELNKIGANVIIGKDFISVKPPIKFKNAIIETYNDHRMAMCFSLISLAGVKITILNPKCVNKTFPKYFKLLKSISYK